MKKARKRDKYFINNECHSRIFGVLHWFKMNCISGIVFKNVHTAHFWTCFGLFVSMFWVAHFWIKLQHSNDLKQSFLSVYPDDTFSIFSKIACVFPIPITGNYFIPFERKCVFFDALNIRTKFFSWMIIFSKKKSVINQSTLKLSILNSKMVHILFALSDYIPNAIIIIDACKYHVHFVNLMENILDYKC